REVPYLPEDDVVWLWPAHRQCQEERPGRPVVRRPALCGGARCRPGWSGLLQPHVQPLTAGSEELTEVRPGQVEELVATAREDGPDRVEGEPLDLLGLDRRWDRELLTFGHHVEQRRPV